MDNEYDEYNGLCWHHLAHVFGKCFSAHPIRNYYAARGVRNNPGQAVISRRVLGRNDRVGSGRAAILLSGQNHRRGVIKGLG